jgi:hypothetical protein
MQATVNAVYSRYFPTNPPARIFVNVPAWAGHFDIEIDRITVVADKSRGGRGRHDCAKLLNKAHTSVSVDVRDRDHPSAPGCFRRDKLNVLTKI